MQIISKRYSSFDSGKGADFEAGKLSLKNLRDIAAGQGESERISGKQEMIKNLINQYIFG